MQVQQSTEVELGLLEELDLADVDLKRKQSQFTIDHSERLHASTNILQGVDSLGGLLDLATDDLGDELGGKLGEGAASSLTLDDLQHLLADSPDLRRASVGGLLDLVGASLGEGNGEQSDQVVIGGLDGDVGLDQGLPLADQGAQLVGCEVQTVEVGQTVLSLDLVHTELNLAESVVLVVLEIGKGDLEDSALQGVVGVLKTAGTVDEGLSNIANLESGRSLHVVRGMIAEKMSKMRCTLTEYSSFLEKGSTVRFLRPFLPLERRLFL